MKTKVYTVPSSSDILKVFNRKKIPYDIAYTNNTTSIKTFIAGQKNEIPL